MYNGNILLCFRWEIIFVCSVVLCTENILHYGESWHRWRSERSLHNSVSI